MPPLRGPLRKKDSHLWERHPDDWYSEPTWCSARLFKLEKFTGRVVDPAAGFGRIVHSAMMAGLDHFGADKAERPGNWMRQDFMERWRGPALDNIVSNPPYGIAEKFVVRALDLAQYKVAMLLPANWVQGDARSRWLETTPLKAVYFITPRPSMPPGPVIEAGLSPGNGTTDYAWFIWSKEEVINGAKIGWCRRDN